MKMYISPVAELFSVDIDDVIRTSLQDVIQNGGEDTDEGWGALITPR